jgi:hypothetical protein
MIKIEHNVITDVITEIEFTTAEIAVCKIDKELAQTEKLAAEIETNKKLAKLQPILDKLGITADEAALLLR